LLSSAPRPREGQGDDGTNGIEQDRTDEEILRDRSIGGAGAVVFALLAGLVLSMIFKSARNLIAPFYFAGGVAFLWRFYSRTWSQLCDASSGAEH
jgi:hypothetical protein